MTLPDHSASRLCNDDALGNVTNEKLQGSLKNAVLGWGLGDRAGLERAENLPPTPAGPAAYPNWAEQRLFDQIFDPKINLLFLEILKFWLIP